MGSTDDPGTWNKLIMYLQARISVYEKREPMGLNDNCQVSRSSFLDKRFLPPSIISDWFLCVGRVDLAKGLNSSASSWIEMLLYNTFYENLDIILAK